MQVYGCCDLVRELYAQIGSGDQATFRKQSAAQSKR